MRDNKRLYKSFTVFLEGGLPPSRKIAEEIFTQIERIAFLLSLNAGAMEIELEEEGPVRNGDECLFLAALSLKIIAGIFPSPIDQRRTEREALRHFLTLVRYYPDSELAVEARGDIADLE